MSLSVDEFGTGIDPSVVDSSHRSHLLYDRHNILAVRLCDKWLHNKNGEGIVTFDEWGPDTISWAKRPCDELSINSKKPDVVCETYALAAIKRRERLLREVNEEA